jgi:hypothetical protein
MGLSTQKHTPYGSIACVGHIHGVTIVELKGKVRRVEEVLLSQRLVLWRGQAAYSSVGKQEKTKKNKVIILSKERGKKIE